MILSRLFIISLFFQFVFGALLFSNFESHATLSRDIQSVFGGRGAKPGYIDQIEDRTAQFENVVIIPPEHKNEKINYKYKVFTSSLTKEFIEKYEQTFGRTSAEQRLSVANQMSTFDRPDGFSRTQIEANSEQEDYGNFMVKRLLEYHMDNFMKTEPKARPLWDLKEKITRVEVEVAPGMKATSNYSLSGNFLDVKFEHKFAICRALLNMDPKQFGPSEIKKTTLSVSKAITSTVHMETQYVIEQLILKIVAKKQLHPRMEVNLTGSPEISTKSPPEETNMILGGFSWIF